MQSWCEGGPEGWGGPGVAWGKRGASGGAGQDGGIVMGAGRGPSKSLGVYHAPTN